VWSLKLDLLRPDQGLPLDLYDTHVLRTYLHAYMHTCINTCIRRKQAHTPHTLFLSLSHTHTCMCVCVCVCVCGIYVRIYIFVCHIQTIIGCKPVQTPFFPTNLHTHVYGIYVRIRVSYSHANRLYSSFYPFIHPSAPCISRPLRKLSLIHPCHMKRRIHVI